MDTTELQNLLTFTRQIIHTGKGDPLHGARCLIACVEKQPCYNAFLKHTQQRQNSNGFPLKTNTHTQIN